VERSDILNRDATNPRATFAGNLEWPDILPEATFDRIVLTQTLHFLFDMRAGIATLHRALNAIGQRVELISDHTTYLLIQAARVHKTNIFAAAPQQSDHVGKWNGKTSRPLTSAPNPACSFVKRLVPSFVKRPIRKITAAP
jgi:hypothetical protein